MRGGEAPGEGRPDASGGRDEQRRRDEQREPAVGGGRVQRRRLGEESADRPVEVREPEHLFDRFAARPGRPPELLDPVRDVDRDHDGQRERRGGPDEAVASLLLAAGRPD